MRYGNLLHFIIVIIITKWESEIVQDYVERIERQINSSIFYTYPPNSNEFKSSSQDVKNFGVYDFIIIGCGASGAVLANRLSEISNWKILVLEAGGFGNNITDIPNMVQGFIHSEYNWGFRSTIQNSTCLGMFEQRCFYPRGKGVGGTTLINYLMYSRGSPDIFKTWGRDNPGWSYKDVLPFFKKSENFEKTDCDVVVENKYHGEGGPLNIAYRVPRSRFTNYWLRANKEKGFKTVDFNGEKSLGVGPLQLMLKNGRRQDTGTAFIKPILQRKNLKIVTKAYVTKIVIENETVTGVLFTSNNTNYIVRANHEVILSAGVFGSPQILMLSGIGPKNHLQQMKIPLIKNLEVGSVLRDHTDYSGLLFTANFTKRHSTMSEYVEEYLKGIGPLTSPNDISGVGYYKSRLSAGENSPNIELFLIPNDSFSKYITTQLKASVEKQWVNLVKYADFIIHVGTQNTRSTGSVRLQSNNPFDYLAINSNFLTDPGDRDMETLYEGIQLALSIVNTTAFREINASLIKEKLPQCDYLPYLSKSYWFCALRWYTMNFFHPMGSCPMGPDPSKGAVVDAKTRVHGVRNLRVVDASIYPNAVSGHPTAHCIMFGEKISDDIKKDHLGAELNIIK